MKLNCVWKCSTVKLLSFSLLWQLRCVWMKTKMPGNWMCVTVSHTYLQLILSTGKYCQIMYEIEPVTIKRWSVPRIAQCHSIPHLFRLMVMLKVDVRDWSHGMWMPLKWHTVTLFFHHSHLSLFMALPLCNCDPLQAYCWVPQCSGG